MSKQKRFIKILTKKSPEQMLRAFSKVIGVYYLISTTSRSKIRSFPARG